MTDKDKIIDLGYRPANLTLISDEKIIGDFCNTCDYILEGCHEHEQQKSCQSYKEALRQRKQAAQRQLDHCKNLEG